MGESINSPRVSTAYAPTSQTGETLKPWSSSSSWSVTLASPTLAAANRIRNARLVINIPHAIFVGVAGSQPRRFSQFQKAISGKVNVTTQKGLIAWEMVPDTFQSVFSSAQYSKVVPF